MKPLFPEVGGFHHGGYHSPGGFHHGHHGVHHGGFHHSPGGMFHSTPNKMQRKRTVSSDSGCDMGHDTSPDISLDLLEDTVNQWSSRLENVIHQEVLKAKEISEETKQTFYIADTDVREKVLADWRTRIQDLLNLTLDLVECVNNDIKIGLLDSPESGRSFLSDSPLPEEEEPCEDEENYVHEPYEDIHEESDEVTDEVTKKEKKIKKNLPRSKVGRKHRREKFGFRKGYLSKKNSYVHVYSPKEEDKGIFDTDDVTKEVPPPISEATRRRRRKQLGIMKGYPRIAMRKAHRQSKKKVEEICDKLKENEIDELISHISKVGRRHRRNKFGFRKGYLGGKQVQTQTLSESPVDQETIITKKLDDLCNRVIYPSSKAGRRRLRKRLGIMKGFLSKYKRKRGLSNARMTKKNVEEVFEKLKEHEINQRRMSRCSPVDGFSSKIKMFQSVLDPEDILEDWNWNFDEWEEVEDIFKEWKHNFKETKEAEDIFQDWKWNLKEHVEPEDIFHSWKWNLKEEVEPEDIFHSWKWNLKEHVEPEDIFHSWKWNLKEHVDPEDIFHSWKWNLKEHIEPEDVFHSWKWNLKEEIEPEEIFHVWKWNLKENVEPEDIFQSWRWNLKEHVEPEDIFYTWKNNLKEQSDTVEIFDGWKWNFEEKTEEDWTKWKFWDTFGSAMDTVRNKEEAELSPFYFEFGTVEEIIRNTEEAWSSLWNTEMEDGWTCNLVDSTNWKYWDSFGSVQEILYNTEIVWSTDLTESCWSDGTENDWSIFWNRFWSNDEEDWTKWKFWDSFGSVKDILDSTEEVELAPFWYQVGTVEQILKNTLEAEIKEDTDVGRWVNLGSPVLCWSTLYDGDIDAGCLGDDEEYESLLAGRRKSYSRISSPGKEKIQRKSSADSGAEQYTWLPRGCWKRKRPSDEDDETWLGQTLEKKLFGEESYIRQLMQKDTPVVFKDKDVLNNKERKLAAELVFWEDNAREVDKTMAKPKWRKDYEADERYGGELIFWEDSSRDNNDLISWDTEGEIKRLKDILDNKVCNSCMDEYKKSPKYLKRGNAQHVRRRLFDEQVTKSKSMEDTLWGEHKDPLGPLWVDIEEEDPKTRAALYGTPPKLAIAPKPRRKSSSPSKLKKIDKTDIDEIFWDIEQNGKTPTMNEEIENLPFWDSPDVFNDACDQIESNVVYNRLPGNRDPVNIFRSWKFIFSDPKSTEEEEVHKKVDTTETKQKEADITEPSESPEEVSDLEDVFGEWASQSVSDERANRHWQTRGRRKSKHHESTREQNDRVQINRPGTPTITTVTTTPSSQHHTWVKTNPFKQTPVRPTKQTCRRTNRAVQRNKQKFFRQPKPRKT